MIYFYVQFFIFFSHLIVFRNNFCLFSQKSKPINCNICSYETYNEKFLYGLEFKLNECINKTEEIFLNTTIFISTNRKLLNSDGSKQNPYSSIISALETENLLRMRENYKANSSIRFKLFKGTHYIYENDTIYSFIDFFRRIYINIKIEPVFCHEDDNKEICINENLNEKCIIMIQSNKFCFFISKKYEINNVVFEFYDKIINNVKTIKGFFNIEKIIDINIDSSPIQFILKNSEFFNFYLNFTSFIIIDLYSNYNILFEFFKIENFYFSNGLFYQYDTYQFFIRDESFNYLFNVNDNFIDIYHSNFANLDRNLTDFLIQISNYIGFLNFVSNKIINCALKKGFLELDSKINLFFKINITNNYFESNIFNYFIRISRNYIKTNSKTNIISNILINNTIMNYFFFYFNDFTLISGIFENLILPFNSFIINEFTNLTLHSCLFKNIKFLAKPINSIYLIIFSSIFETPQSIIFLTAKKNNNYYTNDTLTIYNSSFENNQNIQFFKNLYVTFLITIQNSYFRNIILNDLENPFFNFIPESNLIIENCAFKLINSMIRIINIFNFLQITLNNTFFHDILVKNDLLIYLNSYLPVLMIHKFNLIFLSFQNIMILAQSDYTHLIYMDSQTGSGPFMNFTYLIFKNISFNSENKHHAIICAEGLGLLMMNISIFESHNCILIQYNPKDKTSFLNISYFIGFNSKETSGGIITDANLDIFSIKNSILIHNIILSQNCIYIFGSNYLFGQNVIIEAFSPYEGCLLFLQVSNIMNLFIYNFKFTNYNFSLFNSLRISTSKTIIKTENLRNFTPVYGIHDSTFHNSSHTLIILLPYSLMFFKNCSFYNIFSPEIGTIYLMESSNAFFINASIIKSKTQGSGGSFYSENSELFLINVNIYDSFAVDNGGLGNIINSKAVILDSEFINIGSKNSGGGFSISNSEILIENCSFSKGKSMFFGGFIYCKNCILKIKESLFLNGISDKYGGVFFLENSNYEINNNIIKNSKGKMGIFYIVGKHTQNSLIFGCIIIGNIAEINLLFVTDNFLKIEKCLFKDNYVINGIFYQSYGFSLTISVEIKNIYFIENLCERYFRMENAFPNFESVLMIKNRNYNDIFYFLEVNGTFNNFLNIMVEKEVGKSIISMENSNFIFNNSKFYCNFSSNAFYMIKSDILIENSIFFKGLGNCGGGVSLYFSKFFGIKLYFFDNIALKGGCIYAENSGIFLNLSIFKNNIAKNSASDLEILNYDHNLDFFQNIIVNCIFEGFFKGSMHLLSHFFIIKNVIFIGEIEKFSSQAVFFEKSEKISIIESSFLNILEDSVILVKTISAFDSAEINIKNSNFSFGNSICGSFLNFEGKNKVYLEGNRFINGKSRDFGGAIYYSCVLICDFQCKNNSFINNFAGINGAAIKIDSNIQFFSNDFFYNNTALYSLDISSIPSTLIVIIFNNNTENSIFYERISEIKNFKEYNNLSDINFFSNKTILKPGDKYHIIAILTDSEKNIVKLESTTQLLIYSDKKILNLQNNLAIFNQGIAQFHDFIISGPTNSIITLYFKFKSTLYPSVYLNFTSILLANCEKGESYSDFRCKKCPLEQYSLDYIPNSDSCKDCPSNSVCFGIYKILPNIGYWRKDENSSIILKCLNDDACPLQNISNFINFECGIGYQGNICYNCIEGYGNIYFNCIKCKDNQLIIFISYAVGYIFSLSYTLYMEKQKGKDDNFIIMLNKLFINHLSVFIVLSALRVEWGNFLKKLLFLTVNYFSIFSPFVFSTDCFIEVKNININSIIIGFSPFYLAIFSILFRFMIEVMIIVYKYKKKKTVIQELKKNLKKYIDLKWLFVLLIKYLIIIYLGLYSNLLNSLLKLFGCKYLNNTSLSYMTHYPNYECYNSEHYTYLGIGFIFIFIWAFIFPLFILILVYKNNYKKHQQSFFLDYMIKGYKKKYYYWDIVILGRKLISILVSIGSETMDISSIGGILIIIFFIFLLFNVSLEPQESKIIGKFENLSIYITIFSIGFGIITNFKDSSENFKYFLYSSMILMNFCFFGILLLRYLIIFLKRVRNFRLSKELNSQKINSSLFNEFSSLKKNKTIKSKLKLFGNNFKKNKR